MHDKRQLTNAGQQRCTSHKRQPLKQAAVHALNQDTVVLTERCLLVPSVDTNTPHTHLTAPCATKAPARDMATQDPPRAQQGLAQHTQN